MTDPCYRRNAGCIYTLKYHLVSCSKYRRKVLTGKLTDDLHNLLRKKAEEAGVEVITVNPRNTSQLCSRCGAVVKKSLRVRVHDCPHCGLKLDRDVNAARNVLAFALNPHHSWGLNPARTERSEPNVDQWVERALRSCCLLATE